MKRVVFRCLGVKMPQKPHFPPFGRQKGAWGGPGAPDHENSSKTNRFGVVFGAVFRCLGDKMPQNPLNSLKFTSFPHLGAQMGLGGAPARQTMKTAVITTISGGYLGCQNGKRVENTTEIGF